MTGFIACYSLGGITNVLLFYFVKNWVYVLVFYYILGYAIAGVVFFLFVESPPIEIISHSKNPR